MHRINRLIISLLTTAGLALMSAGGLHGAWDRVVADRLETERMKNVVVRAQAAERPALQPVSAVRTAAETAAPMPEPASTPTPTPPPVPELEVYAAPVTNPALDDIRETTISGGMRIKNQTAYYVDIGALLNEGPGLTLPQGEPQILIIHTHASEAYTQAGLDRYVASDSYRTEDTQFNIVRIGDELTEILTQAGLNVIHDRGIYDYPSYTGSYTRSGEAVEQYLDSFPSIRMVLDIHRDALGSEGVVYKTMAEEDGTVASQVMLLVGTDESGLPHPNWRGNLALALYLQSAVVGANPTLMRPVELVSQRYNQHLTPGSLIVEVGSSGNTLREALSAVRLFGNAIAPALLALVETDAE
ncbi:MAG: stage II sporulation protein P [Oscillospiraceae bacterium]|nr:stage II sporulation protein P [Oscillospiraceae bacterium]